eukprot:gene5489-3911_t
MSRKTGGGHHGGSKKFVVGDCTFFCVLDFEATCWRNERSTDQEIIEFPSLLVRMDWHSHLAEIVGEFHQYVRPVLRPELSEFCTELTGITQAQVDAADSLEDVLAMHQAWLQSLVPEPHAADVIFVTCGNWDLKTMLPLEYSNKADRLPSLPAQLYHHFVNVKFAYEACRRGESARGMTTMLDALGLPLEGRHHSGIDDTRNIARILTHLLVADGTLTPAIVAKQAQPLRLRR